MHGVAHTREAYPTDLDEAAWRRIEPLIPAARSNSEIGGRARKTDMREVVNALLYRAHTRCPWRFLPHDFPHWQIVRHYEIEWEKSGRLQRIMALIATGSGTSPASFVDLGHRT